MAKESLLKRLPKLFVVLSLALFCAEARPEARLLRLELLTERFNLLRQGLIGLLFRVLSKSQLPRLYDLSGGLCHQVLDWFEIRKDAIRRGFLALNGRQNRAGGVKQQIQRGLARLNMKRAAQ